ncbi:hypothetical protein BKA67DRAFT_379332 [Truncatella angustata]|uniref:Uncharacterized protein n=1 Tax=Truncatella angustata TaxID=152316 RepID=A0A9P8UFR9_9PEZI|nr:uncharacterized protein BKA67DRAFT_379332 [Truncatella angustata]KAH6649008.1 hypothetical protein BKA67DRAFT_379332 [Truncatella angustata]
MHFSHIFLVSFQCFPCFGNMSDHVQPLFRHVLSLIWASLRANIFPVRLFFPIQALLWHRDLFCKGQARISTNVMRVYLPLYLHCSVFLHNNRKQNDPAEQGDRSFPFCGISD